MPVNVRFKFFARLFQTMAARSRAALEALSRKEIQQLAMDANLRANQKTASLIEQLLGAGEGALSAWADAAPSHHEGCCGKEPPGRTRAPLADVSNGNAGSAAKLSMTPPMPRPAEGAGAACAGGDEDALARQLAAVSLGALPAGSGADEEHGEPPHAAVAHADAAVESASSASPPGFAPWEEEEGELETIRETLAQLLELGFSEEEAQWAIDEAKKKCQSHLGERSAGGQAPAGADALDEDGGLADQLDKLSLQSKAAPPASPLSTSCQHAASPTPSSRSPTALRASTPQESATRLEQHTKAHVQADREQAPQTGIQQVLDLVLPCMDTWTLSFCASLVSQGWQRAVVKALALKPDAACSVPADHAPSAQVAAQVGDEVASLLRRCCTALAVVCVSVGVGVVCVCTCG